MKIIEDKVTVYPPHALCSADIPVIFGAVPPEWISGIEKVRLSAAVDFRRIAYFNPYRSQLTITSRHHRKESTLRAILNELAVNGTPVQFRRGHNLQERDKGFIDRAIAPYMEQIFPLLSQTKVWLDK